MENKEFDIVRIENKDPDENGDTRIDITIMDSWLDEVREKNKFSGYDRDESVYIIENLIKGFDTLTSMAVFMQAQVKELKYGKSDTKQAL